MDQLRKALVWLKQQHFWVLSVLVAIIALVCWKMAAARLSKEFQANQQTITSAFENETKFRGVPFHPNEDVNAKQIEQIDLQAKNVESIWRTLYERQSKNVLKWPEALSPKFRDYVAKRRFGDPIPRDLRDNYRDYIDRHFESLPKRIGARVMEGNEQGFGGGERFSRGGGGGRGFFGGEGGPSFRSGDSALAPGAQDDDYLCEWLDQGLVRQQLDFPTTPSDIKIWVTQEDLWVYHTLLNIIANTNDAAHADRMSNAAVRTVQSLEVGQPAAFASQGRGRVEIIKAPSSGTPMGEGGEGGAVAMEGGGERSMEGGAPFMGGSREMGGGGGMSPDQERGALLAARYLDEMGKPIGGGGAAAATEGGEAAAPSVELPKGPFKRLPIRMILDMDQRWLTHLITECANQPLPVEVTEVRINPADAGGRGGGGEGMRFGGDGAGGGGSSYQPQLGAGNDPLTFKLYPNRVTVVIQGIVTIFNEPDPTQLKPEGGGQMAATTP